MSERLTPEKVELIRKFWWNYATIGFENVRADVLALISDRAELEMENAELRAAMSKISDIRDDIISRGCVNISRHMYPLVAILDKAGFPGKGYEESREKAMTLDEENAALRERLAAMEKIAEDLTHLEFHPSAAIAQSIDGRRLLKDIINLKDNALAALDNKDADHDGEGK